MRIAHCNAKLAKEVPVHRIERWGQAFEGNMPWVGSGGRVGSLDGALILNGFPECHYVGPLFQKFGLCCNHRTTVWIHALVGS